MPFTQFCDEHDQRNNVNVKMLLMLTLYCKVCKKYSFINIPI